MLTLSLSAVPEKGRQPLAGLPLAGSLLLVCTHFEMVGRPVWPIILQHFGHYQSSQEPGTGHTRQAGPLNLVNRSRVGRHVSSICSLIGCPALSLFEADPLFSTSTIDFNDSCPHLPALYDFFRVSLAVKTSAPTLTGQGPEAMLRRLPDALGHPSRRAQTSYSAISMLFGCFLTWVLEPPPLSLYLPPSPTLFLSFWASNSVSAFF